MNIPSLQTLWNPIVLGKVSHQALRREGSLNANTEITTLEKLKLRIEMPRKVLKYIKYNIFFCTKHKNNQVQNGGFALNFLFATKLSPTLTWRRGTEQLGSVQINYWLWESWIINDKMSDMNIENILRWFKVRRDWWSRFIQVENWSSQIFLR